MVSIISFSAQFGGRNAARKFLPYFKLLKLVTKKIEIEKFPFAKLVFIFRIDGEVNNYGCSGLDNIDIDGGNTYLSIDVCINSEEIDSNNICKNKDIVTDHIMKTILFLKNRDDIALKNIDFYELKTALELLCLKFKESSLA